MEDSILYGPLHNQQALDAFKVCFVKYTNI